MNTNLLNAITTGIQTGLSPAQQVDISQYYGQQQNRQQDNTVLYIAIIAAVLISAGTIYFITQSK